ncbi:hypothetical protein F66182_6049 [Fusarium sp. NRRL 66182]|nr:hypothetical protein F66182_6049 [Fusarium sp. NRRL 66182]
MASAQKAEQTVHGSNGHGTLVGKYIEQSASRLLYELLRYANGRTFNNASAANKSPFITLKIYPDRVVADCNNDDLGKADLEAICQPVNKEQVKGAGFKTIIAATKKAHIQSGNLSSEFQHNILDTDGDMMRPTWVTHAETIPNNLTRITLYLHDQGSMGHVQNLRNVIVSQFQSLQEECLLFLKHLQSMRIEFFDQGGKMYQARYFQKHTIDRYRVSLKVTTVDDGKKNTLSQLYHVIGQSADHLSTNLMLAFPLTDRFEVRPDTKAKRLFNLIPLQTSPLEVDYTRPRPIHICSLIILRKFHVHSDFDFKHGGHDLVTTPADALRVKNQVATTFFQATLHLDADIQSWIAQNPVLLSQDLKHWRLTSHLAILDEIAQDKAGSPLLDDPINDSILSSKYPPKAANTLKEYGLETFNKTWFLELLELHFHNPSLRLSTMGCTQEWHNTLARLLPQFLADEEHSERIKSLLLLQLRDGSLVSAASGPVYFSTTGDIDIPESLNLRVVSSSASRGLYLRTLCQQLGVLQATVAQVRSLILDGFSTSKDLSLDDIKSYLRYLYLTHKQFHAEYEQPYHAVKIMTLEMAIKRPCVSIVYLPGTDHPYTPQNLLGLSHALNFLHPEILEDAPDRPGFLHLPWKMWLCECLGIRERLSLFRPKTLGGQESTTGEMDVLSEDYEYVLKHHPARLLGLVQHLWAFDGPRLLRSPNLVSEIQGLAAQNLCAVDRPLNLRDAWVPFKELKECVEHYMEYPDEFPFLKLEGEEQMDLAIATKDSG